MRTSIAQEASGALLTDEGVLGVAPHVEQVRRAVRRAAELARQVVRLA